MKVTATHVLTAGLTACGGSVTPRTDENYPRNEHPGLWSVVGRVAVVRFDTVPTGLSRWVAVEMVTNEIVGHGSSLTTLNENMLHAEYKKRFGAWHC